MAKKVQTIKDFNYRVIGYIEVDDDGSKTVKDFYRRVVGKYDPKQDVTKDFYGRVVARGDATSLLLSNNKK